MVNRGGLPLYHLPLPRPEMEEHHYDLLFVWFSAGFLVIFGHSWLTWCDFRRRYLLTTEVLLCLGKSENSVRRLLCLFGQMVEMSLQVSADLLYNNIHIYYYYYTNFIYLI